MPTDMSLIRVLQRLHACQDLASVQAVVRETARQLIGADGISLVLREEARVLHVEEAGVGPLWKGRRFSIDGSCAGWSILNRLPLVIDDVQADDHPGCEAYRPTLVKGLAMMPLRAESPIGALGAHWVRHHSAGVDQLAVMKALADSIGIAIGNAKLIGALVDGNRQRDEFLAMLAHELRSPLAPIRNAVHLLHGELLEPSHIEWVRDVMDRQVKHLSRMVDDLLDVSRITTGKAALRRDRIDLNRLVGEALGDRAMMFEAAGVVRRFEPERQPLEVMGDDMRLTQVLGNVLDNAAKFTPRGGEVGVYLSREDERSAVIRVRDTGVGIDAALLPHLFGPFAQPDRSIDLREQGLGLGLAVAKGLVEGHGGSIGATSAGRDRGTEIEIRLPLADAVISDAAPEPETQPSRLDGLRALIIEDNVDAAETMQMLLEQAGVQVQTAHDAVSGIRAAESFAPDFVLCDIGLPGMDGYAVARALRDAPATASARLIALTGYGGANDRHQALRAGFDVHLVKPVEPDLLIAQIVKPGRRSAFEHGAVRASQAGELPG